MPFENLYTVLGVTKDCSPLTARKAYRRLVLKYHPDRNPGDSAAEEQFKKIVAAYQVISDVAKRAEYDMRLSALDDAIAASQRAAAERREARRAEAKVSDRAREVLRSRRWEDELYRTDSNDLDGRDLRNGMLAGSAIVAGGALFSQASFFVVLMWAALPAALTSVGYWVGQLVASRIDWVMTDSLLPDMRDLVARAMPGVGAWTGAWIGERVLVSCGVPAMPSLLLPVTLAAGFAAATGSAFGRAFTSVARRMAAKLFGVAVGAGVGVLIGFLLGLVFVTFACGLSAEGAQIFDLLFSGALAAGASAALASGFGSLRPL